MCRIWYPSGVALITFLSALLSGGHLLQAAPISFPGSNITYVYQEDFDGTLGTEWTLDGWQTAAVFTSGAVDVTANGTGNRQVRPSNPTGLSYSSATFPLASIVTADSFLNYGFADNWLVNAALGTTTGTATVEFNNLPEHESIDLDFLLAAGDSIDGGEGIFTVIVDGNVVFSYDFSSGGNGLSGSGIVKMVGGGNLDNYYREQWQDNSGAGPTDENDRFGQSWTFDSAYDMSGALALTAIPHTADTLTVQFTHDLSSNYTDEYNAVEGFSITLNDVTVPEPSTLVLLAAGLVSLLVHRRWMNQK